MNMKDLHLYKLALGILFGHTSVSFLLVLLYFLSPCFG